ncbi:hypothetical protein ASD21_08950 [Caulobacter sp. Root1455]|nr:hypothetical protein ASD21_08950 [Caulobacter sp. Root1455]
MVGLLVLFLIVAIGLSCLLGRAFVRRLARRPAAILTSAVLAGLLAASCDVAYKAASEAPSPAASPCAAAAPDPACDAAERTRYLAELADQQIRTMPVLVKWRDQLPWGKQTPITVIIASADRAAAETALDAAAVKSGGQVEEKPVAIGRRVRAELTGLNVEIDKPEQTVRDVTALQNVTFEWLVKPTRPGKTVLTLRIFNELITPDGPIELERPALVHEMSVKIGFLDWLTWQMERMTGLQWAIGGVLTVLGLAFANRAKLRRWWRRRQSPKPPEP